MTAMLQVVFMAIGLAVLLGITLSYACSFIFIYGAEKTNKALHQNCSTSEMSIAQPVQVVDEGVLQPEQTIEEELPQPEYELCVQLPFG